MEIFRVFDWDGSSTGDSFGGPLYVPAHLQGSGRHDVPDLDGVLYCASSDTCAVVEVIQAFRGTSISPADFRKPGGRIRRALAQLDPGDLVLPDLANPDTLSTHGWSAAQVVSMDRAVTQRMSRTLHREGVAGFLWPSAVHQECRNLTLFQSRVRGGITLRGPAQSLSTTLPAVRRAAALLSIRVE